jgi:hypothetical protein
MCPSTSIKRRLNRRSKTGSNAVEFTYCLVFLFFLILLPLANYGTFMTRWAISSQIVTAWTQNMAKKRKLSDAFNTLRTEQFYKEVANPTGVQVKTVTPALIISQVMDPTKSMRVETPGKVPPNWQPNGGNYNYTLQVVVLSQIDPLVTVQFFGMKIPGLTEPAEVTMSASSLWENMGRDPVTTEFYLNE